MTMAYSRRPARFKRPSNLRNRTITDEQLQALRAAAARVYRTDKENPTVDDSSGVNKASKAAADENVHIKGKDEGSISGDKLSAEAGCEIGEVKKEI